MEEGLAMIRLAAGPFLYYLGLFNSLQIQTQAASGTSLHLASTTRDYDQKAELAIEKVTTAARDEKLIS